MKNLRLFFGTLINYALGNNSLGKSGKSPKHFLINNSLSEMAEKVFEKKRAKKIKWKKFFVSLYNNFLHENLHSTKNMFYRSPRAVSCLHYMHIEKGL